MSSTESEPTPAADADAPLDADALADAGLDPASPDAEAGEATSEEDDTTEE